MNQILSVEEHNKETIKREKKQKKQKNNPKVETQTIVKFFAIVIIIFGACMIGTGAYSMYQQSKISSAYAKPIINVGEPTETEVTVKVEHTKQLAKFIYYWNNEEQTETQCEGSKTFEQIITIPTGTNTLNVIVTDINGQEAKYQKTYTIEGDIKIDFTVEGNNLKIETTGKEELSYLTYRWDEGEEVKVDINDVGIEQKIEIPKGLHTLTVVVVDKNNKSETRTQEVNGVTKPKVEVTTDGANNFIIHATDEQGLSKIEFIINEDEKYMLNLDGRKELEYPYPLHDGENRLEIRVYNVNDINETSKVLVNK